jgi:hypothetical protein
MLHIGLPYTGHSPRNEEIRHVTGHMTTNKGHSPRNEEIRHVTGHMTTEQMQHGRSSLNIVMQRLCHSSLFHLVTVWYR